MLGLAGIPLGVDFRFLDPSPDAPAGAVGPLVTGALDDQAALAETARGADVVTYEWEGVPADSARFLARQVPVRPGDTSLEVSQDRLVEKESFRAIGIATAEYVPVDSQDELETAADRIGFPAVLKTRRGGYDGKGQRVLRTADDVHTAWSELSGSPLILEGFVPFTREVSIIAVRGAGRRGCLLARRRERSRRRHPAHHPRPCARARQLAPDPRRRLRPPIARPRRSRRRARDRAVRGERRAPRQRVRTTRAQLAVTGRSRGPTRASSRTTCARSSIGPSGRPRRAV